MTLDPVARPAWQGAILEIANRFWTASVLSGVAIRIGRNLASCFRRVLLLTGRQ